MAKSIIFEGEVQRFIDLGLGRGVDSTKPSPWINKSSFLVRTATFDNVIGTDEGGFLQSYKSEISSAFDIQAELKSSIAIPNSPVTLGLEGEIARSTNSSKKVVGRKIVNRTISFRVDYQDIDQPPAVKDPSTSDKNEVDAPVVQEMHSRIQSRPSFEESISKWLLKRANDRGGLKVSGRAPFTGQAIEMLNEYLSKASKEEAAMIVNDCSEFITSFGVTHYVSSITLGASEHTVMTESEYSLMIREGIDVSIANIGGAQQKMTTKSKSTKSQMKSQKIGKIVDDRVGRGSNSEAVIGITILPINGLIHKNRLLYLSLSKALAEHIEEKSLKLSKSCNTMQLKHMIL